MTPLPCSVMAGDRPGFCTHCGVPIAYPRRRWCSDEHGKWWGDNHTWTSARHVAIQRATLRIQAGAVHHFWTFCDLCRADTSAPEVNHVDPRWGRGYGNGCHNHQTNLQVLCHDCHLAETAMQKRERMVIDVMDPDRRPYEMPGMTPAQITAFVERGAFPASAEVTPLPLGLSA